MFLAFPTLLGCSENSRIHRFFGSLGGQQAFEKRVCRNAYPCIPAIDAFPRF